MEYGSEAMNKVQIVIRASKETEVTVCAGAPLGGKGEVGVAGAGIPGGGKHKCPRRHSVPVTSGLQ